MHLERLAQANPQPSTRELGLHSNLDSRVLPTAELSAASAEAYSDPAETACRGLYPPCVITPAISRGSSIDAGSPVRGPSLGTTPLRGAQGREPHGAPPSYTIF